MTAVYNVVYVGNRKPLDPFTARKTMGQQQTGGRQVVAVRLDREDADRINAAAQNTGLSNADFLRKAVRDAITASAAQK